MSLNSTELFAFDSLRLSFCSLLNVVLIVRGTVVKVSVMLIYKKLHVSRRFDCIIRQSFSRYCTVKVTFQILYRTYKSKCKF